MSRRERWVAIVTLVLLQVFVAATGTYVVANDVSLNALTGESPRPIVSGKPPSVPVRTAGPVLVAGGNGPLPTKGTLTGRLAEALGDPALGSRVGASLIDARTGVALYGKSPDVGITPASTTKVVTGVAALASLGPDTRLTTRVVKGPTAASIVLVGGGDPTLAGPKPGKGTPYPKQASLGQLASRTATALKGMGLRNVRLSYDDSLFTGPRTGPGWKPGYVPEGSVAPVHALAMDEGRVSPDSGARVGDPARTAATAFAGLLRRQGVTVAGKIQPVKATSEVDELARVESAPVYALVERMLTLSDNDLAEALARHVAIKEGKGASFASVAPAVESVLRKLGLDQGVEVFDGSGLSIRNRISPVALARLVSLAAAPSNPRLHSAVSGMPVAGFTGTLQRRFTERGGHAGLGMVRAKTGTLNGVNTLAGVATTKEGRLLAFAFMADKVSASWGKAEVALDRLAAILADGT
ncbi:D-alanyl-D-alanine carboxypeptidase / D-alanyl-D-alanine-endopeptidase (penicillin-binding protein 4) [Sinosporangium album]|uniref:D-alanyl-D-alanine carboxypeptidase / D-alanyl-D-alanine-endopeptidase (Penicillin-binding protein 4) n=1 Tax=Sinosporangium album TaxID=504805 RepID=A0A1G8FDD6_9ACTN|nr:D-alanyl-D-alanine carboxypeptidase/D-alanyl-D-alanine-endopeptidase [Sinosporangium album]SDH80184.1 D-alanyl-D-alanine carboxypeptidase / D-alanyl-D-alanine-endopeptidase (penicillin-binding protein 4) [Sinosporangium album]